MNSNAPTVSRGQLLVAFDDLLQPTQWRDYGPNGLQVEGGPVVRKIVSGVTASLAFIDAAIAVGADALFVHHGLFWRGQDARITGWMKRRLARLLAHDINLYAYHLPLDAHPELGNNAQLARKLGIYVDTATTSRFGEQSLGFIGDCVPTSAVAFARHAEQILGGRATFVGKAEQTVRRVALCTGGAQSYFEAAIAAGADLFVTGEISEPQAHYARESGVAYLACGHHATERYGAPAVAAHVAAQFGLAHEFIDIDNPA